MASGSTSRAWKPVIVYFRQLTFWLATILLGNHLLVKFYFLNNNAKKQQRQEVNRAR